MQYRVIIGNNYCVEYVQFHIPRILGTEHQSHCVINSSGQTETIISPRLDCKQMWISHKLNPHNYPILWSGVHNSVHTGIEFAMATSHLSQQTRPKIEPFLPSRASSALFSLFFSALFLYSIQPTTRDSLGRYESQGRSENRPWLSTNAYASWLLGQAHTQRR